MSSSSSSSDSDGMFNNFQKYKRKHQSKKRKQKAEPSSSSPTKKFESQFKALEKITNKVSSDEECIVDETIEQLIEAQKKKKVVVKPFEIELLDDSNLSQPQEEEAAAEEPGPSSKTRGQKKKQVPQEPPRIQRKADSYLQELKQIEFEQQCQHEAHTNAVKYIANHIEPIQHKSADDYVSVYLGILPEGDFHHIFKLKYTDRFDNVFLDYGSMAGFDKPEDFRIVWEKDDEFKNIKYFDTPEKLEMPLRGSVKLFINPKEGVKRQQREEGEIKIKLMLKDKKEHLEKMIHKEMPFGEFKVELCAELKVAPGKVRFIFDGDKVTEDDTPESLELEDYDMIEVRIDK